MKLKDLKPADFFTLCPMNGRTPKDSQVWIKSYYDREEKKFVCTNFADISHSRLLNGEKEVFQDMIF